jgi:hypothetical protein
MDICITFETFVTIYQATRLPFPQYAILYSKNLEIP